MQLFSSFQSTLANLLEQHRDVVVMLCWLVFLAPFTFFLLGEQDRLQHLPRSLDVGIITVAAALGGLVLNAGLSLYGQKRKETIKVAKQLIYSTILMIVFAPSLHFVELLGGVKLYSFKFDTLEAWFRGLYFGIAAASFYGGTSYLIIALVGLIYAVRHIGDIESANRLKHGTPRQNGPC